MNLKDSYFHGGSTEHGLIKDISLSSSTLTIAYADKDGTSKTIDLTGIVPSTSDFAKLLKPIANTTTAFASTWSIPSGSKQVWGEKFSDSTLKYTPSGGSATTITDTGDLVMFLTPSATTNNCTLNIRIDGTFYGSFDGGIKVTLHLVNDVDYPLIWSNQTGNSTSISSLFKSWKELYYNPANKRLTTGHLATLATNTYDIGAKTVEYANTFTRVINSRHLNACATVDDHSLYIGYGNNVDTVTNKTLFYYSHVDNNAVARTLMAEVNSSCFKMYNSARIEGAKGLLYIRGTGTGDNYSIIRFGNDKGDDKAYIFLNSSDRTADGGASLMTIRNNVGNLRLNNDVNVTGRLSIGSSTSSNYITFYGLGGDGGDNYDAGHTYIGNRLYAGNDRSELLIFLGNDINYNTTSLTTTTGTQDRIRHISGAHVFQAASAGLSGTFENVGNSDKLVNLVEFNKTSADFYTKALFKYNNKTKLELRADNEGGNIRIYSPDSYVYYTNTSGTTADNYWEIDAYNDNLRFYTFTPGNATTLSVATSILTLSRTGGITASKFVKTSGTSSQFLKADGSVDSTAYIPLAGTSTSAPITGTLYSKAGLYIYKDANSDVEIWHLDGDSTAWNDKYGFTLKYLGSNSANDNDLVLYSHNLATGNKKEVYRVHQDGLFIFGADPYVSTNKIAHAGNVETGDSNGLVKIAGTNVSVKGLGSNAYSSTAYLPLTGGTLTNTGAVTLTINCSTANATTNNLQFNVQDTQKAFVGLVIGKALLGLNGGARLGIDSNGTPIYTSNSSTWNTIAHAGNVSNKSATIGTSDTVIATIAGVDIKAKIASYLPTSGGTLSNANFGDALTIRRTSVGNYAAIRFQNYSSGTTVLTVGYIGMGALDGHLVRISGTNTSNLYSILDASDFITSIASTNTDTQVPTAKAVYTAINNLLATSDALVYKGTLSGNANNTNGGTLTPAASKGWVYKVNQSGYINGTAVEVGDMLICNTDSTPAATTSGDNIYSTVNAKWDFIQANLDPNQYVTVAGIQSITGEKTFTKANIGQLYVTGLAQFTNVISGSINGNAVTADRLKNARTLKVNLATTTAQSFNGSANAEAIGVSGTLPTANGGTGNANGTIPYTKLTGSATTANQAIVSSGTANGWTLKTLGSNAFNSTAYLPLTGGTMTNPTDGVAIISRAGVSSVWKLGRNNALIRLTTNSGYSPILSTKTTSGSWELGPYVSDELWFSYITDADFNSSDAGTNRQTAHFRFTSDNKFYIGGKLTAHAGNSTQSAVTLTWGTNTNALKIAGTLFNVVLPSNPDRYVNSAGFAMDADNGIKMTLTRAGADTSTVTATIAQLASTTGRGLTPKLALASTDTIATQASEYVLTYKSGTETTPVWRKLPANAWNNTTNPTWTSNASDAAYPIGFCTTASPTSGNRYNDYYNTIFTFNPSTKSLKIDGCTLQYDSTNKCLKFIFAA